MGTRPRSAILAEDLAKKAIEYSRVEPYVERCVKRRGECLEICGERLCPSGRVLVIGAGKASGKMAETVEKVLGDLIDYGVVSIPEKALSSHSTKRIDLIGGGHPLPNDGSIEAATRILRLAENSGEDDLVLALISGGGSALMEKPISDEITLRDLVAMNDLLLKSGATIREINAVRKHVSAIKGGRLASTAYPAAVRTLLVSDVPGDRLDVIASGPTVPDPTTYRDALGVLERYSLTERMPRSILTTLTKGARGELPETPKPGDQSLTRTRNHLIATSLEALKRVEEYARSKGMRTLLLTTRLEGESREVGIALASIAIEAYERGIPLEPPAAILAGGETYVRVRGHGKGGRNMELALAFALKARGYRDIAIAAIDTDGIDGVTDAAGAVAHGGLIDEAVEMRIDPFEYLENNDSYSFFKRLGGLIRTGPTHTNLKSMYFIVIDSKTDD